jgi:nucleoside-diphosphate-sugar epimerase
MKTNKKTLKKILIIGSDGYIGSLLINYLKNKKFNITTLDTGYFRDGFIDEATNSKINIDVRKYDLSNLKKFNSVIFLAANQNDPGGKINSKKFYDISRKFTLKVARKCKEYNVKFVFPSSCSVYGYGKKKFNEKTKTNPLTLYSKNKIEIERGLSKIAGKNFSPVALRFSTIFGFSSRIRFDLVINMFCLHAITSKKIYLNSNGLSWRPHLSVEDACKAIYLVLNKTFNNGQLNVFNVGHNSQNMQIIKVAKMIASMTNSKLVFKLNDKNTFVSDKNVKSGIDKRSYVVDFSKFLKLFPNFLKKNSIEKEIKILIQKLKKLKINQNHITNYRFYRLQKIEYLINTKKINNNLYWIKSK